LSLDEEKKESLEEEQLNPDGMGETAEAEKAEESPDSETPETPEETRETGDGKEPEKKEERRFFKKKEKEKKKDERDEKIETLTDQYKRLMAEFDNFRKRTDKEKSQMYDMGVSSAVEKILPVIDSFERALTTVSEEKREDPAYVGMKLIYDQLMKTLTDIGVEPINAEGQDFDPNYHNAVMQVENDELKPGTVAAELQKGYLYRGNVIRHSMVSVVQE